LKNILLELDNKKNILRISFVFFILASIFSSGFHHADEHYQILEFAGSKLGTTEVENLPWEYQAKLRPTIQPTIVIGVFHLLDLFGFSDPFTITFVLRLLSATLTLISLILLFRTFESNFSQPKFRKWFLWLSFLLWFGLYNGVRFSSESWSGGIYVISFSLYFLSKSKNLLLYFYLGVLFGFSFLFRFQGAIFVIGFLAWMLIINKEKIKNILVIILGTLIVIGLGVLLDSWFYDEFTISFWNYFDVNILQDKAASFGVDPWYFYFMNFFNNAVPPFSLLFIIAFIGFVIFKPKSAVTWSVLPFLLIHLLIGHKELRFLFPMVGFIPFIVVSFLQIIQMEKNINILSNKFFKIFMYLFFLVNIVLVVVVSFRSTSSKIALFRKIYLRSEAPVNLYYINSNPYESNNDIYFYRRKNLNLIPIKSFVDIPKNSENKLALVEYGKQSNIIPNHCSIIYSSYPEWVKYFNFNNWIERSGGWKLYEVND